MVPKGKWLKKLIRKISTNVGATDWFMIGPSRIKPHKPGGTRSLGGMNDKKSLAKRFHATGGWRKEGLEVLEQGLNTS